MNAAHIDGDNADVVIIGSGHAGVQVAISLREEGYAGGIVVVGDELAEPYNRPSLSKEHLAATDSSEPQPLTPKGQLASLGVRVLLGVAVESLDLDGHSVTLSSGEQLAWGELVLATGASHRVLPLDGAELSNAFYLRTLAHADALRAALADAKRVVVVGAGFIALEFAAVARARDLEVTVIAPDRALARAVSAPLSEYVERVHRELGSELLLDRGVEGFEHDGTRVTAVVDSTGVRHEADLVVIGIGAIPRTDLAQNAGLEVSDGILVGPDLRTSHPHVWAVGDCARMRIAGAHGEEGTSVRLESVQNAVGQAQHAAAIIAGSERGDYADVPWFWSHQGPLRLQMAGLAYQADEFVIPGDVDSGKFSVFCFRQGELVAVESVNKPADHMAARVALRDRGGDIHPDTVREPGFTLKGWLAEHPA
ncbi:MAG TPA: FAD-dependent oxidoreductase [Pseudolysinimonas sp.]|nr:FAD-dependent oxidoreductase [Pseudolysinimonas sp.]